MKKIIIPILTTILTTTMVVTGCTSSEQKVENAEAKVTETKEDLKNEIKDSNMAVVKAASADEWKMFKNDAEATIKNNEIKIGNLKMKMKKPVTQSDLVYTNSINALEDQNKNLKNKIDAYDKNQSDWQTFKSEFNHDMEGLGKAFRDLTVNNK